MFSMGMGRMGGIGGIGVVAFSPASLFAAGEQGGWYDQTDLSTLFQDSGGTVPVTASRQTVSKMLDKSGRGNHITFTNVKLEQDAAGYYLGFNGVTNTGASSTMDFTGTNKLTVWVAYRKTAAAAAWLLEHGPNSVGAVGTFGHLLGNPDSQESLVLTGSINGYSYVNADGGMSPNTKTATLALDLSAATASLREIIRFNGAATTIIGPSGAGDGGGNFANYALNVGNRAGGLSPFNGRLYGLIVRGALSSAGSVADGEAYMLARSTAGVGTLAVIAVGDSTVASWLNCMPVTSNIYGITPTIVAVPGHTISQQKTAWQALSSGVKLAQQVAVIQIGLNDLNPSEAASDAIARLQDLVATVRADVSGTCKVYIAKMTPCRQRLIDVYGATDGPLSQQKWVDINEAIAGNGATPITGVDGRIIAHTPLMADGSGNLLAALAADVTIHPNDAGRQINGYAWRDKFVSDGLLT